MDVQLSERPRDWCECILSESKELREVMEVMVIVEIEEESLQLCGCTELVSEPTDVQLSERLRGDTEEVSVWKVLPMCCIWAANYIKYIYIYYNNFTSSHSIIV